MKVFTKVCILERLTVTQIFSCTIACPLFAKYKIYFFVHLIDQKIEILSYFLVNQLNNYVEINKSFADFFFSNPSINVETKDFFVFINNSFNSR